MEPSKAKMKKVAEEEEKDDEEEEDAEELEGFDDFTLASKWERFISELEAVCRLWLVDGPKNLLNKGADSVGVDKLYKVKSEVKYGTKSYCMEYYFEITGNGKFVQWISDLHNLQLSFGVKEFLLIAPVSASGVILDAPEASKLLSAAAIALSNCGSNWPAFVPVHDSSRKAYIGTQNMGTVFTRRFEADRIGSQVPVRLMHLEGLYELFVAKFAFSMGDFSANAFPVHFTMRLTYRTLPHDDDNDNIRGGESQITESGENSEGDTHIKSHWDDDCPWSEWYSAEDLIKGFELVTIWPSRIVESSLEMAELENASSHDAESWLLLPILSPNLNADCKGKMTCFATQLHRLVNALDISFAAQFLEDFTSAENPCSDNLKSSIPVPPPSVLDRVLTDLFEGGEQNSSFKDDVPQNSRAIKAAPLESLFAQFCLHSLWFGDCHIRAIAVLWLEIVREVRWYWEESQPLPRMPKNGCIDLSACLIHQKLQMLAICIDKKCMVKNDFQHGSGGSKAEGKQLEGLTQMSESSVSGDKCDSSSTPGAPQNINSAKSAPGHRSGSFSGSASIELPDRVRRGSAGPVDMMLLNSYQQMHAPYTQDPPIMTEDLHEERLCAAEALGYTSSFSAQLEKEVLSSDMSAFKAANPDAVFEDFIRWHSPGDWEDDENGVNVKSVNKKSDWPPPGKLSHRMSEGGNSWRQIWNNSPALPVSEQKPLMDPNREGEKILHYLETLQPHQLLEQMVCTAFKASLDCLSRTSFGNLGQMSLKIEQLYLTMASSLKSLQASDFKDKNELVQDLKRLGDVFEDVEKLLIFAASIHRKLLNAPHLCKAIFSHYYNFYLPRMGTSLAGSSIEKEFDVRQPVSTLERHVVTNIFTPPTANQSWRKVLSMGNLLNGHEPILREIIFALYDNLRIGHYGTGTSWHPREIETHRMYICGTSNDLSVALSVTSCD